VPTTTITKDGLSAEVVAYIEGLEGENNDLADALDEATEALTKAAAGDPDDDDEDGDELDDEDLVQKGVDPEIVEMIKGVKAENEALRARIDADAAAASLAAQTTIAKSFGIGEIDPLAKALHDVNANCDTESYDTITKALTAARTAVDEAVAMNPSGSAADDDRSDDISKAATIADAARELIEKGTAKSQSDAMRQLINTRPELFSQED
jgi:hypothetical protein